MTAEQLRKMGFDDAADALTEKHNEREARRVAVEHAAKNPHEPYITPSGLHAQRLTNGREVYGRTAEELENNIAEILRLDRLATQRLVARLGAGAEAETFEQAAERCARDARANFKTLGYKGDDGRNDIGLRYNE